ncbi:hypothetical protein LINPERPRIM_LOCUS37471 [Linum perenne]
MQVSLPNGLKVSVTHVGSVQLMNSLVIHDVLVIPTFNFNLLSVSKLISHHTYTISMYDDVCKIQDRASLMKIGTARESR